MEEKGKCSEQFTGKPGQLLPVLCVGFCVRDIFVSRLLYFHECTHRENLGRK